jgi:lipopolysaccharide biosynthesis glycosyltransferase
VNSGATACVFAGDEAFARGLAVAVHTTLVNLPPGCRPEVFVLDNGMAAESLARLQRVVRQTAREEQLHFIHIAPKALEELPTPTYVSAATYSRLLIPELLPPQVQRVLYLDSDVLVRRDPSPLFAVDLEGAPFGAVQDFAITTTDHERSGARRLGIARAYFNAGVLVIDLEAWRTSGLGAAAMRYASETSEVLSYPDQDALNAVAERWHALDPTWNVQTMNVSLARRRWVTERRAYRRDRALCRTAAVFHYIDQKPWMPSCESIGTWAWTRALLRSGWYRPREAMSWFARWSAAQARARPAITARRWRARLATFRGSAERA